MKRLENWCLSGSETPLAAIPYMFTPIFRYVSSCFCYCFPSFFNYFPCSPLMFLPVSCVRSHETTYLSAKIRIFNFQVIRSKAKENESNMLVQHHWTCWIKKCWMRLQTMFDESLNQFKHSFNISLAFFLLDDVGCVFARIEHAGPTF